MRVKQILITSAENTDTEALNRELSGCIQVDTHKLPDGVLLLAFWPDEQKDGPICPKCGSGNVIKAGDDNYVCKDCQKIF